MEDHPIVSQNDWLQDARNIQILCLSLFLILGIGTRDWTLRPAMIGMAIGTCLLTQWAIQWLLNQSHSQETVTSLAPFNWRSPLITALSLSLLLRTDHLLTMGLAGMGAIASKSLFRVQGKHWFNPANFGIIVVLLLTQDAWVSPGQWGDEAWYSLVFLGAGGLVLKRVGRWDTSVAFLSTYAGLEALRNLWLGWSWDVWAHRLTSGSILLFALFMITDPRSIPNARLGRLIWASAIALLTFILRNQFFVSSAIFWALFALAPLTVLLDRLHPAERFTWTPNPQIPNSKPVLKEAKPINFRPEAPV